MRRLLTAIFLLSAPLLAVDSGYPGAPASVVAAYLEADGAGLALDGKSVPQLLKFTTWPEAPGWDSFVVVRSYEFGEVGWTGDRATVEIIYDVLGSLDEIRFTAGRSREAVTFTVEKSEGRWKIVRPQLPPHLFLPAAIIAIDGAGARDDADGRAAVQKLRALE